MPTFTKKIPTAAGHRVVERTTDDPAEANSLRYSGWQQTADPADGTDLADAPESEPEPGSGAAVDPASASESELSLIPAPSEDPDGHAAD